MSRSRNPVEGRTYSHEPADVQQPEVQVHLRYEGGNCCQSGVDSCTTRPTYCGVSLFPVLKKRTPKRQTLTSTEAGMRRYFQSFRALSKPPAQKVRPAQVMQVEMQRKSNRPNSWPVRSAQARMERSYKHYERWFDAVFMVSQAEQDGAEPHLRCNCQLDGREGGNAIPLLTSSRRWITSEMTNFREYAQPGHQPADSVRGWVDSRSQNCASNEQPSRAADSDVIELRSLALIQFSQGKKKDIAPHTKVCRPRSWGASGRLRDCEMETQDDETSWMFMVIGTKQVNRGNQQKAG
ncbi:hypothetical protein B0H13DRAFT_1884457 [Mycena leptocephala]|nr:hypothetical protein B0H13DRAFT_1884457 [Mycena leptocephala]